ncbi:hypothetical protein L612_007700000010 [Rhodococcus rhodochrous J38]|uniref:hypothetical protein n=1 Tax=Rhodococcus rhodochrous TaxID=1829 RepID=UPI00119DACB6|nr:hypothetical protein [Rhodococcus rhodochrous]MCB8909022.1 hypothetical protein [Rhodococcus rhodochrous]TWH37593.1 hypothetical protein L612_007700000010 [Rhodococcus rhodochrous J38]
MNTRTFRVTVTVEQEYTADIEIDEAEYHEWRGVFEDNEETRLEFLQAGDELEVINEVCSRSDAVVEVAESAIKAVK